MTLKPGATIAMKPCPFCGGNGFVDFESELHGKEYFTVGCHTPKCFAYTGNQGTAFPVDQAIDLIIGWNTRQPITEPPVDTKEATQKSTSEADKADSRPSAASRRPAGSTRKPQSE